MYLGVRVLFSLCSCRNSDGVITIASFNRIRELLGKMCFIRFKTCRNITAGHLLLSILSGFTFNIMASGFIFFIIGLLPLAFIIAFCGLEIGISFIQAQVFVVLTSSYIKDALELHGGSSSSSSSKTKDGTSLNF
jgi:F0F1-type ATP synthase membrane subunit a